MINDTTTLLVAVNIFVTVGGFIKFALDYERRISKIEATLSFYLKHIRDEARVKL